MKYLQLLTLLIVNSIAQAQTFVDVTQSAGLTLDHQTSQDVIAIEDQESNTINHVPELNNMAHLLSSWMTGGVAAGDYDSDGWQDLYVVGGDMGQSKLFRNLGNGQFQDVTVITGMQNNTGRIAGAVFADYDGDNDLDLFLGGMLGESPRLMRNDININGQFTDVFATAFPDYQIQFAPNAYGASFGDINNDGCLDIYIPHSLTPQSPYPRLQPPNGSTQQLWKSDCQGQFIDISVSSQIAGLYDIWDHVPGRRDETFIGYFSDLNNDGYQDIIVSADIGTSLVLINQGDETFFNNTEDNVIDDQYAMGAALGDLNQDGHIDWFSSNIGMPQNGNRIFYGEGDGSFINDSDQSGLKEGQWGWGACFIDVNADQLLDVFHVNGFYYGNNQHPGAINERFHDTPAALFIANGDGTFTESAATYGIGDTNEGRGVSCFDYDNDGDLDIAISNYKGPFKLYRNDVVTAPINYLHVKLTGLPNNPQGIGSRLTLTSQNPSEPGLLVQEIYSGNNFNSSNPSMAYFSLGAWEGPFDLHIKWLDHQQKHLTGLSKNQILTVDAADRYIFKDDFE